MIIWVTTPFKMQSRWRRQVKRIRSSLVCVQERCCICLWQLQVFRGPNRRCQSKNERWSAPRTLYRLFKNCSDAGWPVSEAQTRLSNVTTNVLNSPFHKMKRALHSREPFTQTLPECASAGTPGAYTWSTGTSHPTHPPSRTTTGTLPAVSRARPPPTSLYLELFSLTLYFFRSEQNILKHFLEYFVSFPIWNFALRLSSIQTHPILKKFWPTFLIYWRF
jgi:hypothetical protein